MTRSEGSFHGVLSDICLASLGVFVLLYVVLIVCSQADVLEKKAQLAAVKADTNAVCTEVEAMRATVEERIAHRTGADTARLDEKRNALRRAEEETTAIESQLAALRKDIETQVGVMPIDETQLKDLMAEAKLIRNRVDDAVKQIRLRRDKVRQEFNVYKNTATQRPYLEFWTARASSQKGVMCDWIVFGAGENMFAIERDDFRRTILKKLNAGSGFFFRYIGEGRCPAWVDDMFAAESWPPAME
jgi:hypothetical protein